MSNHPSENCSTEENPLYVFYSSVMIVEFVLALPLNLSVIYIFIFKLKFWKTKGNNIFLFNLVLADVLLLICLPVKAADYKKGQRWNDSDVVCKAMLFVMFLNRGASIAFLTLISIDRYFRVVHPGKRVFHRILKKSPIISVCIWLVLLPMTIPTMLKTFECCAQSREDDNIIDTFRKILFFSQVLIPFVILVFCSAQIIKRLTQKSVGDKTKLRRAVFLVSMVMLVFSLCFLPSTISRMVLLIVRDMDSEDAERIAVNVYDGFMCLSFLDCLLDPIVYCLTSTKFKDVYVSTFLPCLRAEEEQPEESTQSAGNNPNPGRVQTTPSIKYQCY